MTKDGEDYQTVKLTEAETEEFRFIWTVVATMEKHGYQCTSSKLVERVSYLEPHAHQKKLVLTFVLRTEEKNTLFSTFQDLEKLMQDYTKYSKKSKMEWYLTTDTRVDVEISKELK